MATIKEKEKAKEFVRELLQADNILKAAANSVNATISKYNSIMTSVDDTDRKLIVAGLTSESLDIEAIKDDLIKFQAIITNIADNRPKYKG